MIKCQRKLYVNISTDGFIGLNVYGFGSLRVCWKLFPSKVIDRLQEILFVILRNGNGFPFELIIQFDVLLSPCS